jgi:hypothetical protein
VALVPDIWQHNFNTFLGLCAVLTLSACEAQLVVLGVRRIEGESAEDIKIGTENIVNDYIFDYKKIKGIPYYI